MHVLKKTLLFVILTITGIVIVAILFVSPITKYVIEKYDEKFTGRKITVNWVYVNPFSGHIYISKLKIFEQNSDSVFFSANSLNADFSMLKMLSKTYEISEITLDQPLGIITQNKNILNFSDLIGRFSGKGLTSAATPPVHFNIINIKIRNGKFYYYEKQTPVNYFIKNVNIESEGKYWNSDSIAAKISFLSGIGSGDIKGEIAINFKNLNYDLNIKINKYDLNIIGQYLKELTNYGTFSASLDADLYSTGNFKDQENITAKGLVAVNDFHFGKNPKDDYAAFKKLFLRINEVSPKNHTYLFDSITLSHPYFKYERYDYLDNLQTMFGKNGSNIEASGKDSAKFNLVIEIARYVKVLARNFFESSYKINRLAIYNGDLKFNDYAISEKFAVGIKPITLIADSIDKTNTSVNVNFKTGIQPYGSIAIGLSINPKDSSDFDIHYHIKQLPLTIFNPYLISFTSFPLDRGTIELNGSWHVRNGNIKSDNHLLILDPRISWRVRNKDTKWIPMRLIMAFVRERGNVIDYQIPITGNLNDPKFHFRDVIFDILENIFVKPSTTAYRMEVKNIETEIEKSLSLKWEMHKSALRSEQKRFLEKITDFLENNPEATIEVYPQYYEIKEKEYILIYEAKLKYLLTKVNKSASSVNTDDVAGIDRISIKDSLFIQYLDKQVRDSMLFTVQEKCSRLISQDFLNEKYNAINKKRENAFLQPFKERNLQKQAKINKEVSVIPYNGFSFYKIEYKGDFPESVIKAYQAINKLNDRSPRNKFKMKRAKNKNIL